MTYINQLLLIPDTQVRPEVNIDHLGNMGEQIAEDQPDVIVHIGDHWDMPSLSSYDRGTAKIEGRRVRTDIEAGNTAMRLLLEPLRRLQQSQSRNHKKVYRPRLVFIPGNHEERILRYENNHPEVQGALGYDTLDLTGWEVSKFLDVVTIGGVGFSHYFYNPNTGRPYSGTAEHRLNKIKHSFVQGHEQGFKYHMEAVGDKRIHGLVAGSFYTHDESYKGPQGNTHWRGACKLWGVQDGMFDLEVMDIKRFL